MTLTLKHSGIYGEFTPPKNKSSLIRLLLLGAFSREGLIIIGKNDCKDVIDTINCINRLGGKVIENEKGYNVFPIKRTTSTEKTVLNVGESGALLRFLLPMVSATDIPSKFVLNGNLIYRPIDEILDILSLDGCTVSKENNTVSVEGVLLGGEYNISCLRSSQFLSGLIMALCLTEKGGIIKVDDIKYSKSYVDLTIDILRRLDKNITVFDNTVFVEGGGIQGSLNPILCDDDYSLVAPFAVASALNGNITINTVVDTASTNFIIFDILKSSGAIVTYNKNTITVEKGVLNAISVDGRNIPDLLPLLILYSSFCKGVSTFSAINKLKYKESNRLDFIENALKSMNVKYTLSGDILSVFGGNRSKEIELDCFNDHRLIMAGEVLSTKLDVRLINSQGEEKSFNGFTALFNSLKTV